MTMEMFNLLKIMKLESRNNKNLMNVHQSRMEFKKLMNRSYRVNGNVKINSELSRTLRFFLLL